MLKYWLARNFGDYEGWKLDGPFNTLAGVKTELERVLESGNDTPIKLFRELTLEVKDNA